jgi:hypothetical protein
VQTTGELVVAVVELAARVQPREDEFNPGHAKLGMNIDRHAAAIIGHRNGAIAVQHDLDAARMPGERLIDTVVHYLLNQMVRTRGVGVHARASAHRLKPGKYLNGFG